MAENPRIEELRRRVQADPASIAFAALAEEFRRVGRNEDAIETCRTGLQRHPAYLSARVTLGRALIETGEYDAAREELETVLRSAPENLAAIRGLATIHERLGHSTEMDPHLADIMKGHEESIRVAAVKPSPSPEPVVVSAPIAIPEPVVVEQREPELDLSLAPPLGVAPAADPDLAMMLQAEPEPEFEADAERVAASGGDAARLGADAARLGADAARLGADAAMLGADAETLATLARLERFLGAIESLRA